MAKTVLLLFLPALAGPVVADVELRPGLWKISLESRSAASPDGRPAPTERTECLTEPELDHPERLLAEVGLLEHFVCEFPNRKESAGRLTFELACTSGLGVSGQGEVRFTDKTLDGHLDARFAAAPKSALQNQLHAVHVADECPESGPDGL